MKQLRDDEDEALATAFEISRLHSPELLTGPMSGVFSSHVTVTVRYVAGPRSSQFSSAMSLGSFSSSSATQVDAEFVQSLRPHEDFWRPFPN